MMKIEYQRKRRDGVDYGFSCSDCDKEKRIECVITDEVIAIGGEDEINILLTLFADEHKEGHLNSVEKTLDRVGEEF